MLNTLIKLNPSGRLSVPDNPLPTYALFEDTDTQQIVRGAYEWDPVLDSWRPPLTVSGLDSFGADPSARVSLSNRNLLADVSGNPRGSIPDLSLEEILVHYILGSLADPTGITKSKPLQMTRRRGVGMFFGSYGRRQLGRFEVNLDQPNFKGMLDVCIADYRLAIAQGIPKAQLNKVVGFKMIEVFGRMADEYRDFFVPVEERSADPKDDYSEPATPITDDFNRVDSATLGTSSEGWSWTEVGGGTDIVSNAAKATSSTGYNRAESALSGADMYAQANSINDVDGAGRGCGAAVRYAPSADTCYWHKGVRATTITTHELMERTAGTDATHSSTAGYTDANGGVHRIEIVGSDIELFYAGASRHTASDASITGNLYSGICGRHTGTNRLRWDSFEADVIASGGGFAYSQAVIIG